MVAKHQKWLTKILGFNFEIFYRSVKENCATKALSRKGNSISAIIKENFKERGVFQNYLIFN